MPSRLIRPILLAFWLGLPVAAVQPAAAQVSAQGLVAEAHSEAIDALYDALGLPEMVEIMQEEGLDYGRSIATDLLDGGGARWEATVSAIYDADLMSRALRGGLADALDGGDVQAMIDFFKGETGRRIIGLEVSARRAMLDEAVEEAAMAAAAVEMADRTAFHEQVDRFVAANDLIEANVVGAMNANLAFYEGLARGGPFEAMPQQEILSDVWSQEPEIRKNTTEWVYAFLMMAYRPLDPADLDAYIAFSETPEGRALNRAMFAAFDTLYADISRELGQAAAQRLTSQEL